MDKMLKRVEELYNNTPDGQIRDADTILADIIESNDYCESGFAQEIFDIYKECKDKQCFKEMFFAFTDINFEEFLEICEEQTTKS